MSEYNTLLQCADKLELALQSDREAVHHFCKKGYISDEVSDDVLDPKSMLSRTEKAGMLVTGIKRKVKLDPKHYHELMSHFRSETKYADITKILDKSYQELSAPVSTTTDKLEPSTSSGISSQSELKQAHKRRKTCSGGIAETPIQRTGYTDPLKKIEVSLSRAMEEIQSTISEIEAQGDAVASEIDSSFEKFHDIIEEHKKKLFEEAKIKVTQKLEHLFDQEKILSTEYAAVEDMIKRVEDSTDGEIVSMHEAIKRRINNKIALEPVEEVDIGVEVSCAEDLHQLFRTKARIFQIPIRCNVKEQIAEVNKITKFPQLLNLGMSQNFDAECKIKSLYNGSIVKCNVDLIKGNEYRIRYTPTVRGRHELILTANGQEVAGSPFSEFVSIPPTQLGKPVKVIKIDCKPFGIAIDSTGELIITSEKDVLVYDKEGKTILKGMKKSGSHHINNSTGVAVDDADNIYIADVGGPKIFKLNKKLEILNEEDAEKDSRLFGVAVVGDEVMVCDCKNNYILVYTKDLKYVRKINNPTLFSSIRAISPDEHDNLYVCDDGNSRIHVLSNGGEYLHSFGGGSGGSGVNKLNHPRGIYVSGQYVYVANHDNHAIFVYTTEGKYVTSFGQKGSNEGDFIHPRQVCVDKDGFVYVTDFGNGRCQVF